jgi:DNA-binding response OmpR family regulator
MMVHRKVYFICLFWATVLGLQAQSRALQDTLNNRVMLLGALLQSGNSEQAQIEAEWYRDFISRHRLPIQPEALTLISGIYKANKDERSATLMLSEAELSARRDPNPVTKAALLSVLVKECARWDLPELALTTQQMLSVAQDSIRTRAQRKEKIQVKFQLDSLLSLRKKELAIQAQYFQVDRNKAYFLGGVLGLVFFALILANLRNVRRWRKRLQKQEMEMALLQAQPNVLPVDLSSQPATMEEVPVLGADVAPILSPASPTNAWFGGEHPEQIALIIEPNRQIVLYLKSLLADRFQIETARTPNEGLQMANTILPDLIVCDAILNGKTGIDVARQLKLSEKTSHIPIVLLSDHHGNEGKLDALRAGADVWFTRPILDDHFDASIQRLIDSRKVKHTLFQRFLHLYFTENRIAIEDPFLSQTVQYVEQNLSDPNFTAEEIARKMQLTKQHYFKKLLVLTGKEPVQLIREMRLEKAKSLLEKRAGTPQAISELVGFSSPGTFSLAFKEYFGGNTLLLNVEYRR